MKRFKDPEINVIYRAAKELSALPKSARFRALAFLVERESGEPCLWLYRLARGAQAEEQKTGLGGKP